MKRCLKFKYFILNATKRLVPLQEIKTKKNTPSHGAELRNTYRWSTKLIPDDQPSGELTPDKSQHAKRMRLGSIQRSTSSHHGSSRNALVTVDVTRGECQASSERGARSRIEANRRPSKSGCGTGSPAGQRLRMGKVPTVTMFCDFQYPCQRSLLRQFYMPYLENNVCLPTRVHSSDETDGTKCTLQMKQMTQSALFRMISDEKCRFHCKRYIHTHNFLCQRCTDKHSGPGLRTALRQAVGTVLFRHTVTDRPSRYPRAAPDRASRTGAGRRSDAVTSAADRHV